MIYPARKKLPRHLTFNNLETEALNFRHRVILDLSDLNKDVTYNHFKMNTIHTAASLMTKNCYMGSIDLRDAYYTINIAEEDRNYLKFYWKSELFRYTCLS